MLARSGRERASPDLPPHRRRPAEDPAGARALALPLRARVGRDPLGRRMPGTRVVRRAELARPLRGRGRAPRHRRGRRALEEARRGCRLRATPPTRSPGRCLRWSPATSRARRSPRLCAKAARCCVRRPAPARSSDLGSRPVRAARRPGGRRGRSCDGRDRRRGCHALSRLRSRSWPPGRQASRSAVARSSSSPRRRRRLRPGRSWTRGVRGTCGARSPRASRDLEHGADPFAVAMRLSSQVTLVRQAPALSRGGPGRQGHRQAPPQARVSRSQGARPRGELHARRAGRGGHPAGGARRSAEGSQPPLGRARARAHDHRASPRARARRKRRVGAAGSPRLAALGSWGTPAHHPLSSLTTKSARVGDDRAEICVRTRAGHRPRTRRLRAARPETSSAPPDSDESRGRGRSVEAAHELVVGLGGRTPVAVARRPSRAACTASSPWSDSAGSPAAGGRRSRRGASVA